MIIGTSAEPVLKLELILLSTASERRIWRESKQFMCVEIKIFKKLIFI